MSKILGISSGFHDAAVTLIDGEDILFASHSERYSKEKNDPFLNNDLINAALEHGQPDQIVFHEKYNYELFKEEDLKDEDLFGANPNKFTGSQKIYYGQNGEFCKELTYDKNGLLSNEIFSSKCNSDFN